MMIVFMQIHIPDPRINKRIALAKEIGNVSVICVRRATQDIWEPVHTDIPHYTFSLNIPTSKELVKRFFISKRFNTLALKKLEELKPDIIYCGGIDILSIACKYKKKHNCRIYFEVADLRECFIEKPKSIIKKIEKYGISKLEKSCFKDLDFLTLTSMKFYDTHYSLLMERKKIIYVPNVPDISVFNEYKHKENGEFTVGFIGGIRYITQMKLLVDASCEVNCKVLFAGAGGTNDDYKNITEYCQEKKQVTFTGKYEYNTQIAKLYGSADCIYAVYNADNPNVKIALPNKLYESVYCELPIIVAKCTYLSELVDLYGIGISVDHTSKEEICNALKMLMDKSYYEVIKRNCRNHKHEFINNDWVEILKNHFKMYYKP